MVSDLSQLKEGRLLSGYQKKVIANYKQFSFSSKLIRQFPLLAEASVFSWKEQNFFDKYFRVQAAHASSSGALVKICTELVQIQKRFQEGGREETIICSLSRSGANPDSCSEGMLAFCIKLLMQPGPVWTPAHFFVLIYISLLILERK